MSSTPDFDNAAREAVLADPAPLHGSRPGGASAAPAGAQALHALLTPRLVLLLAAAAGLGVAPLYYSQPMLGVLGPDIGASARMVGLVPTLTQLG